jgi:hypothetical protein
MLAHDTATAQIQLILASNDRTRLRALQSDLRSSKFAYFFVNLVQRETLLSAVKTQIRQNGGKIPIVLVLDFRFARKDASALLEIVRAASRSLAIECVITDPPEDARTRERLSSLGARLFDNDASSLEMTLH